MAFTVEDGTIVADANAYVTLAEFDAYWTDRGKTFSGSNLDQLKQEAIVRATDYIEQTYYGRWKGTIVSNEQFLSWPRNVDNADADEIPHRLKQATFTLALEALNDDLNPTLGRNVKREKVDVIEVEYQDGASMKSIRPAVDGFLRPYVCGSSYNRPIIRT